MSTRVLTVIVWLLVLAAPRLASAQLLYALTHDNHLETFAADAPGQMLFRVPITGLQANEQILAIDIGRSTVNSTRWAPWPRRQDPSRGVCIAWRHRAATRR